MAVDTPVRPGSADSDVVARIEKSKPAEAVVPPKQFTFARAQLLGAGGAKGSTNSGSKGGLKFGVPRADLAPLFEQGFEDTAFQVTFDGKNLGVATISGASGRPDAEGRGIGTLTLVHPSTEVRRLGIVFANDLFGREAKLTLTSEQMQFDLTARAQ